MNRFALLAAIVTLTGTAALAENLKGNVPFAFNANGVDLPAGNYELLQQATNANLWLLQNTATGRKIAVMSPGTSMRRTVAESRGPALTFRCVADACALQGLYESGKTLGYTFPMQEKTDAEVQVASTRTVRFGD